MLMSNDAMSLIRAVLLQQEKMFLEQLSELVKKGLLQVEAGPAVFIMDSSNEVKIGNRVKFTLKHQEYIDRLEADNRALRLKLEDLTGGAPIL